jgi:hypothetical protein
MLSSLKSKINIRYFMVGYTSLLFALAALGTRHPLYFLNGLAIVAIYSSADLLWTRAAGGSWRLPISSWISGFILAIVTLPNPSAALVVLLPLLAAATKHLLHFGKMRHLFNPAASALVIASFFAPAVSWWGASWGRPAILATALVGLFILWRQARWHTAVAFLLAFLPLSAFGYLFGGGAAASLYGILKILVTDGVTIFFASVMLIEPVTSYFPTRRQRTVYGALVGVFAAASAYLIGRFANLNLDPLLTGLLLGNLVAGLAFLPPAPKKVIA